MSSAFPTRRHPSSAPHPPSASHLPFVGGGGEASNFAMLKQAASQEEASSGPALASDGGDPLYQRVIRYDPSQKVLGVVESGHPAHEAVCMSFVEQITLQSAKVPPHARLIPLGSPTMVKTPDGVLGRPDACWGPADAVGDPAGPHSKMPYPTLIVESAYQESWPDTMRDVNDWLGTHTDVQVVVVIKIYKPYTEAENMLTSPRMPSVRMEAGYYVRGENGAVQTFDPIQFGSGGRVWNSHPPGVHTAGQQVLTFPNALLWRNSRSFSTDNPPEWMSDNITIDLFDVQQAVLRVS